MVISEDLVKQLVLRNESPTLDFKGDQYAFKGADDRQKSELLKDILHFANAFDTSDAFILIGVQQEDAPPHKIVGVSETLDDAALQDFVDAKTITCPNFCYEQVRVNNVIVGVIHVPRPQSGPFSIKRDYGKLKQNRIPIRQGSRTKYVSPGQYTELAEDRVSAELAKMSSDRLAVSIDRTTQSQLVRLQAAFADDRFNECGRLLREGDVDKALIEIDRVLSNEELVNSLSPESAARAHRVKANLLLRIGDVETAKSLLEQADAIAAEEEPRIRALVALHESGVAAALQVLGTPKTDDGRQLAAQLYLADSKPGQALRLLPEGDPLPANALRPRALAQLMLGMRADALETASEALEREPNWLDSLVTAGITHYFCALSPALSPRQIVAPDPVPPPLFVGDPESLRHLKKAEELIRRALKRTIQSDERLSIETWLLGILAPQADRREHAEEVLQSILRENQTHTTAILWAVSYAMRFDKDAVRQRCLAELAGEKPDASHVVTYLVIESESTSDLLKFLESWRRLFEAQEQTEVYDFWHNRLTSEVSGDGSDLDQGSPIEVIARARESNEWAELDGLVQSHSDDPIILMMAADAFADANQWTILARLSGRLLGEVCTEHAFRLAATAMLNVGDAARCLEIVKSWESRFLGDELPDLEFWRLRSSALAKLGDVRGAMELVTSILKQGGTAQDREQAADIFIRFGDVRSAAPHIEKLIQDDKVSAANALNWSRVVESDDPDLAEKLLDRAAHEGVPPKLIGSAVEIAMRLDRKDLRERFVGEMALAADKPGTRIQSATTDEAVQWLQERHKKLADVQDLYAKGIVTLAMACAATNDNIVARFESAFSSCRRKEWTDALLVYHGSRSRIAEDLPRVSEWVVCMDLTTLLVVDELGLLKTICNAAKAIKFPLELTAAFLELEDQLAGRQPDRLAIIREILAAVDSNAISFKDSKEFIAQRDVVRYVVFEPNSDSTDLVKISIQGLVSDAVEQGVLDESEAIAGLRGYTVPNQQEEKVPEQPILIFDGNTIEVAIEVFGLDRLTRFATCVIEPDYEKIIRRESDVAQIRENARTRAARLRRLVIDGIKGEEYKSMPEVAPPTVSKNGVENAQQAVLFSLLSYPAEEGCVVAFDDRLLNKHQRTDTNTIVCTLDIIECLRRDEIISAESYYEARAKLRDCNLYFSPPSAEEVVYATCRTTVNNGQLVESPSMKAIRRYVLRQQSLHDDLDLGQQPGVPNESMTIISTFRLAANAIEALFASGDTEIEDVQLRASWIWQSLNQTVDGRFPFFNRSPVSILNVLVIQLGGLLISAMTNFMTSERSERLEILRAQVDWAWNTAIAPYVEGNPDLLAGLSAYFKHYAGLFFEGNQESVSDSEREETIRLAKVLVPTFVSVLPTELKDLLLEDEGFTERFGVLVESTAEIRGVFIGASALRAGMIEAVSSGAPISLETQSGPATVCVKKRRSASKPVRVEFEGAIAVVYEDPVLGLLGEDRDEKLTKFLFDTDYIDLASPELSELKGECANLTDAELYELLDTHIRQNVQKNYEQLATSMRLRKPLRKADFDAPTPHSALQSLRLPHRARKRFSFLFDSAAEALINQYGAISAFNRVCGLPIDLAERFVDAFDKLVETRPRKTKAWLLESTGSAISRLHKLALAAALAQRGKLSIAVVRRSVRDLLENWQDKADLFLQILRTTEQLQSHNQEFISLGVEQKLATVWSHAERIARIVGENVKKGDEGIEYFRKIALRTLASELNIQFSYETDAATPGALHAPTLLQYGMAYVHSHNEQALSRPLMLEIGRILMFTDEPNSSLSPRLLQGRSNAADCLDSILKVVDARYVSVFNHANGGLAQTADWFDARKADIRNGRIAAPPDRLLWTEVLAYEQRWLDASTRKRLLGLVNTVKWKSLAAANENVAIVLLCLAAEMISYLEDESEAIEFISTVLTKCHDATVDLVPKSEGDEADSRLTFANAPLEVAFIASRSDDIGRSCRVLAACFRTLASFSPDREAEFIATLETAIPLLPAAHVLPLVELRRVFGTRN